MGRDLDGRWKGNEVAAWQRHSPTACMMCFKDLAMTAQHLANLDAQLHVQQHHNDSRPLSVTYSTRTDVRTRTALHNDNLCSDLPSLPYQLSHSCDRAISTNDRNSEDHRVSVSHANEPCVQRSDGYLDQSHRP